jgi:hypothetical protein
MGMESYPEIDYHIIIEDDYYVDNIYFDIELVELYDKTFPNKTGYLCSLTLNQPFLHAAISNGIIHKNVLNYISLYKYYNLISKETYSQLKFSILMAQNNIIIKDMNYIYDTQFWDTPTQKITDFSKQKNMKRIISPIQILSEFQLSKHDLINIMNNFFEKFIQTIINN